MNIDQNLEQLKKEYLEIEPGERFLSEGFNKLEVYLDKKPSRFIGLNHLARVAVFLTMVVFILSGSLVGMVWASRDSIPGDLLYPLKRATESAIVAIRPDLGGDAALRRSEEVKRLVEENDDSKLIDDSLNEIEREVIKRRERSNNGIDRSLNILKDARDRSSKGSREKIEIFINRIEEEEREKEDDSDKSGDLIDQVRGIKEDSSGRQRGDEDKKDEDLIKIDDSGKSGED